MPDPNPATPVATPAPAAAAPVTPVAPATPAPAAPATPSADGKKSLLDEAGAKAAGTDVGSLHDAAITAVEAWQANPTPELKAAAEKAVADAKAAYKPLPGTPEKYDLKAPEGMTLDETLVAEFTPIFKDAGLSNEQANKLMPIAKTLQEKAIASHIATAQAAETAKFEEEKNASKKALGADLEKTLVKVASARDRLFSKESRELLSKHGNFLPLIRDLAWLGEVIGEDKLVDTGKPAGTKEITAQEMYPNSPSMKTS